MISTVVDFISSGGTNPISQTGDISLILFVLALVMSLLALCFHLIENRDSGFTLLKQSRFGSVVLKSNVIRTISVAMSVMALLMCIIGVSQRAYAEVRSEQPISDHICAYVDEETGEVSFQDIVISNKDDVDEYVLSTRFSLFDGISDGDCEWAASCNGNEIYKGQATGIETILQNAIDIDPGSEAVVSLSCNMGKNTALSLINKSVITISFRTRLEGTYILTWDDEISNIDSVVNDENVEVENGSSLKANTHLRVFTKNINTIDSTFTINNEKGNISKDYPTDAVEMYMPDCDTEIYAKAVENKEFYANYDGDGKLEFFYSSLPASQASNDSKLYRQSEFNFNMQPSEYGPSKDWPYYELQGDIKNVIIDSSVKDFYGFKSTCSMFYDLFFVMDMSGFEYLQTENVTDMSYMFDDFACYEDSFDKIPNVRNWNTSNVEYMNDMFSSYASTNVKDLNQVPDVSLWNTSKVKDMSSMFYDYGGASLALNQVPVVGSWDISNAVDLSNMFSYYGSSSESINVVPDIVNWKTGSVESLEEMFMGYAWDSLLLSNVPDVSGWDVFSCSNFVNMFYEYGRSSIVLTEAPNVANWEIGSTADMYQLFASYGESSDSTFRIDLSTWVTNENLYIDSMFEYSKFSEFSIGPDWKLHITNTKISDDDVDWYKQGDSTAYKLSDIDEMIDSGQITQATKFAIASHTNALENSSFNEEIDWEHWFLKFQTPNDKLLSYKLEYTNDPMATWNTYASGTGSLWYDEKFKEHTYSWYGDEYYYIDKSNNFVYSYSELDENGTTYWRGTISFSSEPNILKVNNHIVDKTKETKENPGYFDDCMTVNNEFIVEAGYSNYPLNITTPSGSTFNYELAYSTDEYNWITYAQGDEKNTLEDTNFTTHYFSCNSDLFYYSEANDKVFEYRYTTLSNMGDKIFWRGRITPNDIDPFLQWEVNGHAVEAESYSLPGKLGDYMSSVVSSLNVEGKWTTDTYVVKYNANGISGDLPDNHILDRGDSATVSDNVSLQIPLRSFLCWNTKPMGDGDDYYVGETITPNRNLTLYAQFIDDAHITYHPGYAEGDPPDDQYKKLGIPIAISGPNTLHMEGYKFIAWTTNLTHPEEGYRYNAGQLYTEDKDLMLYPYFASLTDLGTVTFDANGGIGTCPETIEVLWGEEVTIPDKGDLQKGNLKFLYWNTKPDGSGTTYKPGTKFNLVDYVDLYAIWGADISGIVSDSQNRGIGDVDVSAYRSDGTFINSTKTFSENDASGSYSLEEIEGTSGYLVFKKDGLYKEKVDFSVIDGPVTLNITMNEMRFDFLIQFENGEPDIPVPPGPTPGPTPTPGYNGGSSFSNSSHTGDINILFLFAIIFAIAGVVLILNSSQQHNNNTSKISKIKYLNTIGIAKFLSRKKIILLTGSFMLIVSSLFFAMFMVNTSFASSLYSSGNTDVVKARYYNDGHIEVDNVVFTNRSDEAIFAKNSTIRISDDVKDFGSLIKSYISITGLGGSVYSGNPDGRVYEIPDNLDIIQGGKSTNFSISIENIDHDTLLALDDMNVFSASIVFDYPE